MTPTEAELLRLIRAETDRLQAVPDRYDRSWAYFAYSDARARKTDLAEFGVQVSPEWLGCDPAARQRRRRALQALEHAGLLTITKPERSRVVYAKLTDLGQAATGEGQG